MLFSHHNKSINSSSMGSFGMLLNIIYINRFLFALTNDCHIFYIIIFVTFTIHYPTTIRTDWFQYLLIIQELGTYNCIYFNMTYKYNLIEMIPDNIYYVLGEWRFNNEPKYHQNLILRWSYFLMFNTATLKIYIFLYIK